MKKFFGLINIYGFNIIKIFLYELYFILLGYKGNNFIIRNNKNSTDTIPCPYFFLNEIFSVIKNKNIRSFVDLGSGNGRVIYFFNKRLKIRYTGVEFFLDSYNFSCNIFKFKSNIKIIKNDFFKLGLKNLKYDCYFINDPIKNLKKHNLLIKKILLSQRSTKKPFYFILINLNKSKLKVFNKLHLIKSKKIYNRGYYIYSSFNKI